MVSTLVYDIVITFISAVACLHNLVQPPERTVPRKITSKSATDTRVFVEGGTGLKWCTTRLNISHIGIVLLHQMTSES